LRGARARACVCVGGGMEGIFYTRALLN